MVAQRIWLAVVVVSVSTAVAHAQRVGWVGEGVMLRDDGIRPGRPVGDELVRTGPPLDANLVYLVKNSKEGLLELHHERIIGQAAPLWVRRGDVVRQEDAAGYFTRKIKEEPGVGKWYGRRWLAVGVSRTHVGPSSAAVSLTHTEQDLEQAIRLDPNCLEWRRWWAFSRFSRGPATALRDAEELVRLASEDDLSLINYADALFANSPENYPRVLELMDKVIGRNQQSAAAYYRRGMVRLITKKYDSAIDDFTHAIGLKPGYSLAWSQRGTTLLERHPGGDKRLRTSGGNGSEQRGRPPGSLLIPIGPPKAALPFDRF